eukprot:EG_transcript_4495
MNYLPPREYVEGGKHVNTEIAGRDRPKFFNRPVVPRINPDEDGTMLQMTQTKAYGVMPSNTVMGFAHQSQTSPSKPKRNKTARTIETLLSADLGEAEGATHRTVMCQTDYRENECQTDPFTPDYYVEDGRNPEVLAIMTLTHEEGLPAGLAEVEMIDRIRRRRDVELSLPQGSDDASMKERLEKLEALEHQEWDEREAHIQRLQEQRLKKTAAAILRREARREEASAERIETTHQAKVDETMKLKGQFEARRQKAKRMLERAHANPTKKVPKRDIIDDHARYGTRGKMVETKALTEKLHAANYDVRPTLLSFPEGIGELERTEAPRIQRLKKADVTAPADVLTEELPTQYQKRLARQVVKDLDFANLTILKAKESSAGGTNIQDLYRATPRLIRPDTPTLVLEGDEEEEKEEALVLLQRLLRGRAVQNDFFEGKERCHGLIEELQAAQKAKETEHRYMPQIDAEKTKEEQQRVADGVIDAIQGDIVYSAMDYLFKELIRQREAAKFERLRMEAETTRHLREEQEEKNRAAEERLREREEEQFRQVQRINDYTIHTYLTGLLGSCIDYAAYRTALGEQLEVIDLEAEQGPPEQSKEDQVCELMLNFIIPQVEKERNKRKSEYALMERSKAQAAHLAALAAVEQATQG